MSYIDASLLELYLMSTSLEVYLMSYVDASLLELYLMSSMVKHDISKFN